MAISNITPENLSGLANADITIDACVYRIRKASGLTFVTLRNGRYLFQSIYIPELCKTPLSEVAEGAYIEASASVKEEKRAPYGFELTLKAFKVISKPTSEYPLNVSQPTLGCTLDDNVKNRTVSLKHPNERAIMHIRSAVSFAFSRFMQDNGFIQINTPKITASVSDSDYISAHYFDKDATLTHSPALHKIMAVGGLDRVYEVGAGYSSKNRNSIRHLNEFTRLDFEFSYATRDNVTELLKDAITYIREHVKESCQAELDLLGIKLSEMVNIPSLSYKSAMDILEKSYTQTDLDPTDERKLCEYAKVEFNSDYIFITDMPDEGRPFYEKDGAGFIILSKGIEIASGGEHISDYDEQCKKINARGLDPAFYEAFLDAHKYALPSVGGAGIGLERFIMAMLELDNIRRATLFTRDLHYLIP